MKNWGARLSYIRRVCPRNVCNREICLTPESVRCGVNSSGDMNVQLVNVDGTEPSCQGKECATSECRRYGAKSPGERIARMTVDRGYVHEAA